MLSKQNICFLAKKLTIHRYKKEKLTLISTRYRCTRLRILTILHTNFVCTTYCLTTSEVMLCAPRCNISVWHYRRKRSFRSVCIKCLHPMCPTWHGDTEPSDSRSEVCVTRGSCVRADLRRSLNDTQPTFSVGYKLTRAHTKRWEWGKTDDVSYPG